MFLLFFPDFVTIFSILADFCQFSTIFFHFGRMLYVCCQSYRMFLDICYFCRFTLIERFSLVEKSKRISIQTQCPLSFVSAEVSYNIDKSADFRRILADNFWRSSTTKNLFQAHVYPKSVCRRAKLLSSKNVFPIFIDISPYIYKIV